MTAARLLSEDASLGATGTEKTAVSPRCKNSNRERAASWCVAQAADCCRCCSLASMNVTASCSASSTWKPRPMSTTIRLVSGLRGGGQHNKARCIAAQHEETAQGCVSLSAACGCIIPASVHSRLHVEVAADVDLRGDGRQGLSLQQLQIALQLQAAQKKTANVSTASLRSADGAA